MLGIVVATPIIAISIIKLSALLVSILAVPITALAKIIKRDTKRALLLSAILLGVIFLASYLLMFYVKSQVTPTNEPASNQLPKALQEESQYDDSSEIKSSPQAAELKPVETGYIEIVQDESTDFSATDLTTPLVNNDNLANGWVDVFRLFLLLVLLMSVPVIICVWVYQQRSHSINKAIEFAVIIGALDVILSALITFVILVVVFIPNGQVTIL